MHASKKNNKNSHFDRLHNMAKIHHRSVLTKILSKFSENLFD